MLIVCRHILDEGSFNFADLLRSLGQSYRKKKAKSKDDFRTNKEKGKRKKEKQTHDLKLIIRKVIRL